MARLRELLLPWDSQPDAGAEVSEAIRAAGLVAAWQFAGPRTIDPLSRIAFSLGSGQSVVAGAYGRARRFTGTGLSSGVTSIGGVTLYASGDPWSVFVRYAPESDGTVVGRAAALGTNRVLQLLSGSGTTSPGVIIRGTSTNFNWGFTPGSGWHSVAICFDGSAITVYGDFDRIGSASIGTLGDDSQPFTIGSRTGTTGFPLTGNVESVLIFSTAIPRALHQALHANTNIIWADQIIPVPVSAAAPSSFNPAWAVRQSRTIGAGVI